MNETLNQRFSQECKGGRLSLKSPHYSQDLHLKLFCWLHTMARQRLVRDIISLPDH